MSLSDFAADLIADMENKDGSRINSAKNILKYVEESWGLNQTLYPAQRFILKCFYGLPLSNNKTDNTKSDYNRIPIYSMFMEDLLYEFSEVEYLKYLSDNGRINIKDPVDKPFTILVLAIGRRGSKSALTSFLASYECYKLLHLRNPLDYYKILDTDAISITSVATNTKQAKQIYQNVGGHLNKCSYFKDHISATTLEYVKLRTDHDKEIFETDLNHASIEINFKGAVAKSLRGPNNIVVIFDEMAHFLEEGGKSAAECYDAATPATAGFKNPITNDPEGKVICISSPLAREGKFFELYLQGMQGLEGILVVQAPTWEINPTVSGKYLKQKYKEDPQVFMVEFGAQFTSRIAGWITKEEDLIQNIDPRLGPKVQTYIKRPHFMGIDLGLSNDGTAVALSHIERVENGYSYSDKIEIDLVDIRYPGWGADEGVESLDFEDVADWIQDFCRRFYVAQGSFDAWVGTPLLQALKKRGLNQFEMIKSNIDRNSQIYQSMKLLMLDNKLRLYDSRKPEFKGEDGRKDYISELLELQAKFHGKYRIEVQAPRLEGKHDDMSDAIARSVDLAYAKLTDQKFLALHVAKTNKSDPSRVKIYSSYNSHLRRKKRLHGSYMERSIRK